MEVREPSAKYLARPAYKQSEVGLIPEDWNLAFIEDHAVITTGGRNTQDRVDDGLYPFFVRSQTVERINSYSFDGEAVLTAGDGVGTGKVFHYINGKFDAHQRVYRISDFSEHLNGYFFHLYFSTHFFSRIMQMTAKSSVDSVRREMIARMQIPLPPTISEQQGIAEALSDADALIESLEQLLAKKRQIKQGAMQELLTGQKRLPGFAGEWQTKPMGELFYFSGGYTASRDQLGAEGYCYLHYGDIHTSNKTYVDVRSEFQEIPKLDVPLKKVGSASLLEDGDVVFVDASEDDEGTSKHVVVVKPDGVPFISGLHTIVAKSKTDELENLFKRYCFQTPSVKAQFRFFAVGTKVSGISKSNIGKIAIELPPATDEQTAIATVLSDMDAELASLESKLAKARHLKQGMMQELLTGRIRLV
jgi:type I restriction enzyme S subunit